MNLAINKERLTRFGLVSLLDYYTERRVTFNDMSNKSVIFRYCSFAEDHEVNTIDLTISIKIHESCIALWL